MNNKLKSKTRLAAIQLVSQHLINNQDIEYIKNDFDKYYRNTIIDEDTEKIEYNLSFLSKLISYFKITDFKTLYKEINSKIKFDRKFEKWDNIIQAIIDGWTFKMLCAFIDTPIFYLTSSYLKQKFNLKINEEVVL